MIKTSTHSIMSNNTLLQTTVGSIFSIAIIQPHELLSAFIIGGAGGIGASVLGGVFKWVVDKLKAKIKRMLMKLPPPLCCRNI